LSHPPLRPGESRFALYSVVPDGTLPKDKDAVEMALNRRTQEAAHDLMTNPQWQGKTVVMVVGAQAYRRCQA
jgi:hypothetical protein